MSDHVPDDESYWCGVPLDCHDDLYDAICGRHHQPDPLPGPRDAARPDRPVPGTMITSSRDHDAADSDIRQSARPMPPVAAEPASGFFPRPPDLDAAAI